MKESIRGSDVFLKTDLAAVLMGLQAVAANYPPGDFAAGFLACLSALRYSLNIPATLADIDSMTAGAPPVRVLPPAPAPAAPQLPAGVVGGRRFALRALEIEQWDGAPAPPERAADIPAPRRLQPAAPAAPVVVADTERIVTVEDGSDPVLVRPDLWRLVAHDGAYIYDEIAGPGRYVLPADRWVPVPVAWRGRVGVGPVPDQWALFVTIDWAIRHVGAGRVQVLPDGRRQIRG